MSLHKKFHNKKDLTKEYNKSKKPYIHSIRADRLFAAAPTFRFCGKVKNATLKIGSFQTDLKLRCLLRVSGFQEAKCLSRFNLLPVRDNSRKDLLVISAEGLGNMVDSKNSVYRLSRLHST